MKSNTRIFLEFLALSGAGWLCDFATFTLLVKLAGIPAFAANFVSSYVGVTFVWFTSLERVFGHSGPSRGRSLFVYWVFQFMSILMYSQLLHFFVDNLQTSAFASQSAIAAKIVVTPFNLVTNFFFMKFLIRYMQRSRTL